MNLSAPSPQQTREAIIASARLALWGLASVILALLQRAGERRAFRSAVTFLEGGVRALLLLRAMQRARRAPQQRRASRPSSTPTGFRRGARPIFHRAFTRGITTRGDLRQRLHRVIALLNDPERAIAKLVARLERGLRGARLIAIAPAALVFVVGARAPAPHAADSS